MDENIKIAQATVSLAKMLKFTCCDTDNMIPLQNEIQFLEDYIAIQKLRYGNDIAVLFCIDPELYHYRILKFILQPILENSFVHGFPDNKNDQKVIISGCLETDAILFTIEDNGVGICPQQVDRYTGLGIKNVEQRIQQHYGKQFGITMRSVLHEGTIVTIRLPLIEDESTKDRKEEKDVPDTSGG